jgi:aspartyl protease family protein
MNQPQTGDIIFYMLLLLLPLSSLVARRLPISHVIRMVLAWAGIFSGLLLIVTIASRSGITQRNLVESLGLSDQSVTGQIVSIPKSEDGHFWATVKIGNISRRMLIDSGASVTSISPATANAAGIDATSDHFGTIIQTANGPALVRRASAASVSVGPIVAHNLDLLVGPNFNDSEVIGMNFLSGLKSWRVEGDRMILEPKSK